MVLLLVNDLVNLNQELQTGLRNKSEFGEM
jgi:hypothetical protein